MCIIAYKPAGIEFPSDTILENCFINNDDGAGFMFAYQGQVYIKKGYMKLTSFKKALKNCIKTYGGKELSYVLHFRISTQGGVKPEFTHPYPLSEKLADMKKLSCEAEIGIAHNGIIPITSYKTQKSNDTMEFITDYLSLLIENENYYKNKKTLLLIERLSESKLAILDGEGHCELVGNWLKDNGVFYSNKSFMAYIAPKHNYHFCLLDEEKNDMGDYRFYDEENFYDEETGLYNFDIFDCPALTDGDNEYCEVCVHYRECMGL